MGAPARPAGLPTLASKAGDAASREVGMQGWGWAERVREKVEAAVCGVE